MPNFKVMFRSVSPCHPNWLRAAIAVFANVALVSLVSGADTSWTTPSPNGRFIAVYLSPLDIETQVKEYVEDFPNAPEHEVRELRDELNLIASTYDRSGVYQSDNHESPLWAFSYSGDGAYLGSDGNRLAVPGSAYDPFDDDLIAVVFGPNGYKQLLRESDLLSWKMIVGTRLLRGEDVYIDSMKLGGTGDTIVFTTTQGDEFHVSLADGRLLDTVLSTEMRLTLFLMYAAVLLLLAAIITGVVILIRRNSNARVSGRSDDM